MIFKNRQDAGRQLARKLIEYKNEHPIIVAMPRGGVPLGFEIAKYLQAPLEVLPVRKIGSPASPEFGIGAVSENETLILDEPTIKEMDIPKEMLEKIIKAEKKELKRQSALYRRGRKLQDMKNRTIILVDDGLARGFSARAGTLAIKKHHPGKIIFASPVCAFESALELKNLTNDVICINAPFEFPSVGTWYQDFRQVTDEDVVNFLKQANGQNRSIYKSIE